MKVKEKKRKGMERNGMDEIGEGREEKERKGKEIMEAIIAFLCNK